MEDRSLHGTISIHTEAACNKYLCSSQASHSFKVSEPHKASRYRILLYSNERSNDDESFMSITVRDADSRLRMEVLLKFDGYRCMLGTRTRISTSPSPPTSCHTRYCGK